MSATRFIRLFESSKQKPKTKRQKEREYLDDEPFTGNTDDEPDDRAKGLNALDEPCQKAGNTDGDY